MILFESVTQFDDEQPEPFALNPVHIVSLVPTDNGTQICDTTGTTRETSQPFAEVFNALTAVFEGDAFIEDVADDLFVTDDLFGDTDDGEKPLGVAE